jgi:hypothetical protein
MLVQIDLFEGHGVGLGLSSGALRAARAQK